ncbi:MAG: carboxylating nicotinate-nucleotide diphosphorylase [Solirubrobacteraceae bacterium]
MARAPSRGASAPEPLADTVARALAEDIGPGDVTTRATVPDAARAEATIEQKAPGVVYGLEIVELVFRHLDPEIQLEPRAPEGCWRDAGEVLAARGRAGALLGAERTALNFLGHLSGIATLTARCVRAVEGTGVGILDTRKTTPGLRLLEKAAVRAGGGTNHRAGLYDAILIKDNHVALAGGVGEAVRRARDAAPELEPEVECRSSADIDEALAAGAARILLDNMTPARLRTAVEQVGGRATLEASGGMTLETLREYALTGVQFISVGALTHSAPALDLSLTLHPLR